MPQAEIEKVLNVSKDQLFNAITRYEDYPEFVEGCKSVEVERDGKSQVRATYHLSIFKEFTYVLDHLENKEKGKISWKLLESDLFKVNEGAWTLETVSENETRVRYEIDIEFRIKVPGFIVNKLVQGNLPRMLRSFEQRAQDL